jgi:hypothetical protein
MDKIPDFLNIAAVVVAVASSLSATMGFHKADGPLGAIGRLVNLLALNFGHAQPKDK